MLKILHLYYDIMNLYGENGNIRAISKYLDKQVVKYKIDYKSINDKININSYDFIYIGCGMKEEYNLVLKDINKYKDDLIKYISNNKFILVTGNALNLFSDLKILDFTKNEEEFQIIGEQIYTTTLLDKKIIGFQNRNTCIIKCNEMPLFEVQKGTGYSPKNKNEGVIKNNFYGTYLLGPLLVRNPYLLDYIMKKLLLSKKIAYKKLPKDTSYKAYFEYLKNFDR